MSSIRYIPCESCGTLNKLPIGNGEPVKDKSPSCGNCHATLHTEKSALDVKGAVLKATVANSPVPVIVDFWAPWCGPCRAFGPTYEKFASANPSTAVYLKLNTDDNQEEASELGIRGIPTVIIFENGKPKATRSGSMSLGDFSSWLKENGVQVS